jgi:hypothetical protein
MGCKSREFNSAAQQSSEAVVVTTPAPVSSIGGCYKAVRNGGTQRPVRGGDYVFADVICIRHVERAEKDPFVFSFYTKKVENKSESLSLSKTQPRCPSCWMFSNFFTSIQFDAQRSESIQLTYTDMRESTAATYDVFKWELVRLEDAKVPQVNPTAASTQIPSRSLTVQPTPNPTVGATAQPSK